MRDSKCIFVSFGPEERFTFSCLSSRLAESDFCHSFYLKFGNFLVIILWSCWRPRRRYEDMKWSSGCYVTLPNYNTYLEASGAIADFRN